MRQNSTFGRAGGATRVANQRRIVAARQSSFRRWLVAGQLQQLEGRKQPNVGIVLCNPSLSRWVVDNGAARCGIVDNVEHFSGRILQIGGNNNHASAKQCNVTQNTGNRTVEH